MLFEIVFSILSPLADTLAGERVPGAGFFDDPLVGADVDQLAFFGYTAAVQDIKLRFSERWGNLVLHDLDFGTVADDIFSLLHRAGTTNVEAHRGVELERVAAGSGLRVAEHYADLHADLVDEDHQRARARDRAYQLAQCLRHQPGLQAHLRLAHLTFDLGPRHQRGHRINHDYIDRTAAHEGVGDLQGLLAIVGLGDEQLIGFDSEFLRIAHVQGML